MRYEGLVGGGICAMLGACVAPVDTALPGVNPHTLAVGDFDEDGLDDLAVSFFSSNDDDVSLLLSNGDGTFTTRAADAIGTSIRSLAVADFDGDGHLDLAGAYRYADGIGDVTVWLGDGSGGLARQPTFLALESPYFVAAGDVDGDGFVDLVVGGRDEPFPRRLIDVHWGDGTGVFGAAGARVTADDTLTALRVARLGTGAAHAIIATTPSCVLVVDDIGGAAPGRTFCPAGATDLADVVAPAASLNGDAHADLLLVDRGGAVIGLHQQPGTDGRPDFPGELVQQRAIAPGTTALVAARLDGDPLHDVVVVRPDGDGAGLLLGELAAHSGTPAQLYRPRAEIRDSAGPTPVDVVAGDFTGDGRADIAILNQTGVSVSAYVNPLP